MKWPGLFSMVQIVAGMSMAGPMYVLGVTLAMDGQTATGVGFFALGVIAMFAPTYIVRRIGGPRAWIKRRLDRSNTGVDDEGERFDPLRDT